MNAHHRTTFREIVQATRERAAVSAWERACIASNLRHVAASHGDWRSARRLSRIKQEAIQLVALILPEQLRITLDSYDHVGLVSVRFEGHGRLHLPADSPIRKAAAACPATPCCLATNAVAEAAAT